MVKNRQQAVADYLLGEITAGRLKSGDRAPTETELARRFDLSVSAAHRALKRLEDAGLLVRLRKKGSFISEKANAETAGEVRQGVIRKLYLLLPETTVSEIHWRDAALTEFERAVKADGVKLIYRRFSHGDDESALRGFHASLEEAVNDGAAGIVIGSFAKLPLFINKTRHLTIDRNIPLLIHNVTGEFFPDLLCDMVSQDPYADGVRIGEAVAGGGYRQVLFINSRAYTKPHHKVETSWLRTRVRGVRFGFGTDNGDTEKAFRFFDTEDEFRDVLAAVRQAPRAKTAVVAVNSILAGEFIEFAAANGLAAPGDFGLIAFDDDPSVRHHNITALAAPIPEIGALMGNLIREKLAGGPRYHRWIKVPYELIERETMTKK